MKILSFTQPHTVPNLYDFLSSWEHKRKSLAPKHQKTIIKVNLTFNGNTVKFKILFAAVTLHLHLHMHIVKNAVNALFAHAWILMSHD